MRTILELEAVSLLLAAAQGFLCEMKATVCCLELVMSPRQSELVPHKLEPREASSTRRNSIFLRR